MSACQHTMSRDLKCDKCLIKKSKCKHPEERISSRWHYVNTKLIKASGFCGDCGADFVLNVEKKILELRKI